MTTYSETLDFLFNSLPMYQRVGKAAYKANMDNTIALMDYLDHPERKFKSIHVAGTNGKGSVSHCLASILHQSGLKVGLYTSPHLIDFRERIRINGTMIPEKQVVDFTENHKAFFQKQQLSFFEMTVGMAFDYFAQENVDVAVVEVGMGGRLDSTNVVSPDLCVITNIGFDHTQFLGSTLSLIAGEKAGIIKKNTPVVIGETHPETRLVFEKKAAECESPISFADDRFCLTNIRQQNTCMTFDVERDSSVILRDVTTPLCGAYQLKNMATLFGVLDLLKNMPQYGHITQKHIQDGLRLVVSSTGLRGRWQVMEEKPLVICETAHNADGISYIQERLQQCTYERLFIVYGCVNDKDYGHILDILPKADRYYYTKPSVQRGLDVNVLLETAISHNLPGKGFPTFEETIKVAKLDASENDLILVTGSIFLVADAIAFYETSR